MSASGSILKTSLMLSPLYHPATATGRIAGRLVNTTSRLCTSGLRLGAAPSVAAVRQNDRKQFSTTSAQQLKVKEFFPPTKNDKIAYSPAAWTHPVYTEEQMHNITVQHREAKTFSDRIALALMRVARWGLDTATFYAKEQPVASTSPSDSKAVTKPARKPWLVMDERKWLIRIVFLESIAGVPGMVGGMLRHLHSLRRMKRDNGWIETLLEESYNERMHLLTFMKMAEPGLFMRLMILLAQGVFFNGFTLSYLIAPRACHRFVGYIEEEAVYTYSRIIRDLERGNLPKWADSKLQIPDIAVEYWKIPENKRNMRELLYYVRADEAKHREVNHTLANLDQKVDPNPYTSEYKEREKTRPLPSKGLEHQHPMGWERNEVL